MDVFIPKISGRRGGEISVPGSNIKAE